VSFENEFEVGCKVRYGEIVSSNCVKPKTTSTLSMQYQWVWVIGWISGLCVRV